MIEIPSILKEDQAVLWSSFSLLCTRQSDLCFLLVRECDVQADKVYYTVHTNQCIDVNYRLVTDYIHPIHPPIYTIQKLICHVNAGCQFHILRQVTEFLLIEIAL